MHTRQSVRIRVCNGSNVMVKLSLLHDLSVVLRCTSSQFQFIGVADRTCTEDVYSVFYSSIGARVYIPTCVCEGPRAAWHWYLVSIA